MFFTRTKVTHVLLLCCWCEWTPSKKKQYNVEWEPFLINWVKEKKIKVKIKFSHRSSRILIVWMQIKTKHKTRTTTTIEFFFVDAAPMDCNTIQKRNTYSIFDRPSTALRNAAHFQLFCNYRWIINGILSLKKKKIRNAYVTLNEYYLVQLS